MKVEFKDRSFYINGKPERIISGSMHYFRVHPALWDARLDKAKAMGLNCIETYTAWNLHEPKRGEFNFSGGLDLAFFLKKVAARGMYAILRPGPYICAEWENGGLPAWLSQVENLEYRRLNEPFLKAVFEYLEEVVKVVRGAENIIAVQIENEYGTYGNDTAYLDRYVKFYRAHGVEVPLFTSDGPSDLMLCGGTHPECLATVNFGSRPKEAFEVHRRHRPDEPDFCMEFWDGWFDHWGEEHHHRDADEAAAVLKEILDLGGNVNFYMFHGGTNFGFTNGSNCNPGAMLEPTVTSYDYDSPLSEAGDSTEKYYAFRKVIADFTGREPLPVPPDPEKMSIPKVELKESAPLRENLDRFNSPVESVSPLTQEQLGENFGFVYYSTEVKGPFGPDKLNLMEVNDYAMVWLDGEYLGNRFRENGQNPFSVGVKGEKAKLELLVENCGRTNFGPLTGTDLKGIKGDVAFGFQKLFHWRNIAIPLAAVPRLNYGKFANSQATFHRGTFKLDKVADTFVKRCGVKGVVWINGFNLGRYWGVGPTQTMYVPSPILREGVNEIVVLELEKLNSQFVEFADKPNL